MSFNKLEKRRDGLWVEEKINLEGKELLIKHKATWPQLEVDAERCGTCQEYLDNCVIVVEVAFNSDGKRVDLSDDQKREIGLRLLEEARSKTADFCRKNNVNPCPECGQGGNWM